MPTSPKSTLSGRCVNQMLVECEPIVIALVTTRLTRWPADVQDDVAQVCRLHLWQHVLPQFDPARGPLDAFVRHCLNKVLHREGLKLDKRPSHEQLPHGTDLPAVDDGYDIEQLADRIKDDPEQYLSRKQAKLLRLVLAGGQPRDIGPELGISPASASQALWRLRKKLADQFVDVAA